jgi:CheY-like chemotaxis protein
MARKPHILCVDDRADSLLVRKLMLEQFGCEVTTVTDSAACLEAVGGGTVDLVMIDYHLGESGNGEDLARVIRGSRPQLPLMMLTGDPKVPDSARESVDVLLIKGACNPTDMLNLIQDLLPQAELRPRGRPRFIPGAATRAS